MDKPSKIKCLKDAVRLWCLDKGYNEIDGAMLPYINYTPRTLDEIITGDKTYFQSK